MLCRYIVRGFLLWLALSFGLLPFDRLTQIAYGEILTVHGIAPLRHARGEMFETDFGVFTPEVASAIIANPPSKDNFYTSVKSYMESQGLDEKVSPFHWGGATAVTRDAVKELKEQIKLSYRVSQVKGEPFSIIAHSWGGVLVYMALRELAAEGVDVKVDNLVTMGTPLGYLSQLSEKECSILSLVPEIGESAGAIFVAGFGRAVGRVAAEGLVDPLAPGLASKRELCEHASELVGQQINNLGGIIKNWVNYHSPDDPISAPIASLGVRNRNLQQDLGLPSIGGHSQDHAQYSDVNYQGGLTSWLTSDDRKVRENARAVLGEVSRTILLTELLNRPPSADEISRYSSVEPSRITDVITAFNRVLNRQPTERELYQYVEKYLALAPKPARAIIENVLVKTPEARVRRAYLDILKREPDPGGLEYYTELLQKEQLDEASLRTTLLNSAEYKEIKCPELQQTETAGSPTFEQWKKWIDETLGKSRLLPGC